MRIASAAATGTKRTMRNTLILLFIHHRTEVWSKRLCFQSFQGPLRVLAHPSIRILSQHPQYACAFVGLQSFERAYNLDSHVLIRIAGRLDYAAKRGAGSNE
jgi:hypothetical protein